MKKPLLAVKNLIWEIGAKQILDIRELNIFAGEHLALIGPNGSGKSSLLKMLTFLEKPTAGEVIFNSGTADNYSLIEKRRQMAVVFQEPLLLNMTVYDNIAYGLKIRGRKSLIADNVNYWLERLKIQHLKNRQPKNLSGGEAKRVSIARAMALEPQILFLDEPFSALDAPTKTQLLEELSLIIKDTKITSVFITHEFSELPFMADKVMVLAGGKIAQQGTMDEIFYQPATEEVALLVGADIQLFGQVIDDGKVGKMQLNNRQVLSFINGDKSNILGYQYVKAFIRSEDVRLGTGSCNNFEGKVERLSPYGLQYKLIVDCGFMISLILDKYQFLALKPNLGDLVKINIPQERIHIISLDEANDQGNQLLAGNSRRA